jgi:Ca2+-dependent lipid-binding protein
MGKLTIFLDKVTNLSDKDIMGKSDPYVVFHLEKDGIFFDQDLGTQKSGKKGGTVNPVYRETFMFDCADLLRHLELHITVLEDDRYSDAMLGHCTIQLGKLDLTSVPHEVVAKFDHRLLKTPGEIHLQLSFEESGHSHDTIVKNV